MGALINQTLFVRNAVVGAILLLCTISGFIYNPLIVWGLFVVVITGIIFIGHPPQLLFVYWFWMTVVASILQKFTPGSVFGLVPESMLAAVGGLAILSVAMRRKIPYAYNGILKWYFCLIGIIVISLMFNGAPAKNIAMSITEYYGFFLVFLTTAIFLKPSHRRLKFIAHIAMAHLYLCFMLNVLGFLNLNPFVANRILFDKAVGTFVTQGSMAFYSMAMLFLSIGMVIHLDKGKERFRWIIGAAVSFFNFFLTFTFHAYVYLVALYILFTVLYPKGRAIKIGFAMSAIVLFILSSVFASALMGLGKDEFGQGVMGNLTDTTHIRSRIEMIQESPKMEVFRKMLIYNFSDSPMEWLIGNGPGMGIGTVGVKYVTPTAWEYLGEYYYTQSGTKSMSQRSALQSPHNGLYALWSDIGFIGTLFYIGTYVYAALHLLLNIKKNRYVNSYQQILAESCVLWHVLIVITNFMSDTFYRHELLGGLWIFTALVWVPIKSEGKNEGIAELGKEESDALAQGV